MTEGLASRIVELSAADRGAVRVEVISEADPAGAPDRVRPNRGQVMLVGLLVGLVLGASMALADQRVRSVEEVSAAAGVPILGVIPRMPRSQGEQTRGRQVYLDPMSEVAEAYRAVRTAVFFGPRARTVLVSSAERGEGKSTLAANLAIAMTETGHRVLLMDADLRVPSQHRIFGADNDVGVSSVVAGRAAVERAIYATSIRGLELMPCGPAPFNPSETINNQMFANLLAEMGARYDYVVVDSPPVLAVTDARILGAMCELTVMVVRADRSSRRAVADARDGLLGFGANVLGVVVNDGPRDRQRYGYYGGYGQAQREVAGRRAVRGTGKPRHFVTASEM
jgi:capsular exopolysaccharide synthesis family protein